MLKGIPRKLMILAVLISSAAFAQDPGIFVVPSPQHVILGKGCFEPGGQVISLMQSGLDEGTGQIVWDQLSEAFSQRYGCSVDSAGEAGTFIRMGTFHSDPELAGLIAEQDTGSRAVPGKEGYILKILNKKILLVANEEAGLFYGAQTLKQLLRGYPDPMDLPQMTIYDWPSIGFRCVMDDISRGPVPSNKFIREQIRRYAELKINAISFYIEHVVRTDKYPDFAPSNGAISIEEFRELSDYAADYQIELVGNFQSLAHFEKILSFPQYRHLGATDRMLDPLNPESMQFLRDIYREMAPAFSSVFFTPDCDEAADLSRGEKAYMQQGKSVARVYADHVTGIDSTLRELGKRTIIWGDIVLEHPEILDMIPKDIIIGAWTYGATDPFSEYIDPVRQAGFEFTVSPGVLNSNRLMPDYRMTLANIRNFINEGFDKGALGVYCTVWDDGGMHFFSHDWYGVAYDADQCWRPNHDPEGEFDLRFSRGVYGDTTNIIPEAIHKLNELTDLAPTFEMNSGVFWKSMIPERGEGITFDPDAWMEVKRIAWEASGMLEAARTSYYDRDLDFFRFTASQYRFLAEGRDLLLKASGLYEKACAIQKTDRETAMGYLSEARRNIATCGDRFRWLMTEFGDLWDMENRAYWRDRGMMNYQERTAAFSNQLGLLDAAIENFRMGGYLPPPSELRLEITRHSGQYFQYWLLTGSFPIDSYGESGTDFLLPLGGEAAAKPFPGMRFTDMNGFEREWIKYESPKAAEVDLASVMDPPVKAVAYAYCILNSPDERTVTALLGSNDGATVYCNGNMVYSIHRKRSLIPDEDEITLHLIEGTNHILIRVDQWKAGWEFTFRLRDENVRNHKQKYYIQ